jgi:hypothetical protein
MQEVTASVNVASPHTNANVLTVKSAPSLILEAPNHAQLHVKDQDSVEGRQEMS